jgi:HD-GYP domain-containing protein (c-di-GMP phosphodiesterase class II)
MARHLQSLTNGDDDRSPEVRSSVHPTELAAVSMLAPLPEEAQRELAEHARVRNYRVNEVVFEEGDHGESLHVVRSGRLKVIRPSQDADVILQTLEPGNVFGDLAALNSGARLATVVALTKCQTIELAKADLDRVLDRHPQGVKGMLGALALSLTLAKEEIARHNQVLENRVHERTKELHETQFEIVRRLGQAAESRDEATGSHITRMSQLAEQLGLAAGMDIEDARTLLHAAPMHDIGKIGIPDSILNKPGKLDADEWEVMKSHTTVGANILSGSRSPVVQMAEVIALGHHELWDGSGYPQGLKGEEIPLVARICSVCDVFDALISSRAYKPAWPIDTALSEILHQGGRRLDPRLASLFVKLPFDLTPDAAE